MSNPYSSPQAFDEYPASSPHDGGDLLVVNDGADLLTLNDDNYLKVNDGVSIFNTSPSNPHG